jgi:ribonuclease BN (tRNA processing enzyme)
MRTADASVWIDPGPGTLGGLLEEEALGDIDAIWVSHLHADHTADLLLSIYALDDGRLGSGTPIPVLATKGLRERIAAFLRFYDIPRSHRCGRRSSPL